MSEVACEIVEVDLENEEIGCRTIDGVQATCTRCGHVTESYGTEDRSRRRCLVLMREECPMGESNWYVEE